MAQAHEPKQWLMFSCIPKLTNSYMQLEVATEHLFTWLINILRFKIKTIHPGMNPDGWN